MTSQAELVADRAPRPPGGLAIARRRGDGEVEVARSGPIAPDEVFELGSVTKAVTGLLLAYAVVRGEVTLDTPLADCLPGARPQEPITLGELASHTAGLPRLPFALLRRVGLFARTDPYATTTTEELIDDLAGIRIHRRGRMSYSNVGAALLGQALAARAGCGYEGLVESRVLRPLGVTDVWAAAAPREPRPHDRRGRPVVAWSMGAYAPAGALRGTVDGALALALACMDPPPAMAAAVALALHARTERRDVRCGLGWMRSAVVPGAELWWHNGATNGSRAFVGFDADRRVAVAAAASGPRSPDQAAARAAG